MNPAGPAANLATFLAHAHAIEVDAAERYGLLRDQMAVHNNPAVAGLFAKLAEIEGRHASQIAAAARNNGIALADLAPWDFTWPGFEPPESTPLEAVHHLTTAFEALALALRNEQAAEHFFRTIADQATDIEIQTQAAEFAADETEHVRLVEAWIERLPGERTPPTDDLDLPMPQD